MKMKKNICMLLIFCMTIAMLPINVLSEADHCFLAIEAESGINDMTLPGAFQTVREEEASGGKAMKQYSYEQGEHNSFYFSEEILSTLESKKDIMVSDRATLFNLLIGLNGYTICSGVINEELNGKNIVAVPLAVDDYMEIGYITHSRVGPGKFGTLYIEALKRYTSTQE